jgi:hypothetical protein
MSQLNVISVTQTLRSNMIVHIYRIVRSSTTKFNYLIIDMNCHINLYVTCLNGVLLLL